MLVSQGRPVAEAVRSIGVTPFTYYRWRREYGGLKTDQVKRLKEFEKENERLRKAVSDLTLEKLILREAASGNFWAPPARRRCIDHVMTKLDMSERLACRVLARQVSSLVLIAMAPELIAPDGQGAGRQHQERDDREHT